MENQIFDFNKNRGFKEIFSDTIEFLKQFYKPYFIYILIFAGPFLAFAAYYSSVAQITILKTGDLFSAKELWYALFFDFLSDIIINGISFGFIISYITNQDISRETISLFFNKNLLIIVGATLFSNVFLYFGLLLFIIPGIILTAPLSLYVFDKLLNKQPMDITFTRCLRMSQFEYKLTYGVVLSVYIGIFVIKQFVGALIPIDTPNFIMINIVANVCISVFFSLTSVVIALLYYSVLHKNNYTI